MEPAFHHWFPQNGAWTALKPPPNVLKNPHEPAFHPWVFPKRSPGQPQNHPQPKKKKKSRKKKRIPKTIPHPLDWVFRPEQTWGDEFYGIFGSISQVIRGKGRPNVWKRSVLFFKQVFLIWYLPPLFFTSKLWSETFSPWRAGKGHFNHLWKSFPSANLVSKLSGDARNRAYARLVSGRWTSARWWGCFGMYFFFVFFSLVFFWRILKEEWFATLKETKRWMQTDIFLSQCKDNMLSFLLKVMFGTPTVDGRTPAPPWMYKTL